MQTSPPNPHSDFGEGGPDASEVTGLEPNRSWQNGPRTWASLKPSIKELRENATPAENLMWSALRNCQLNGSRWRRQHAIGGFVVDLYCSSARLIVELDGPVHDQRVQEDRARQDELERRDLRVLRFRNDEVMGDLPLVLSRLLEALDSPSPKSERGPGGEVCV